MGFVILIIVMLLSTAAMAHDSARPELNDWFEHLTSSKGKCCSDADKALVKDADWETFKGPDDKSHYRVRIDKQWIDVPDNAVIKEPNLYGQAVVWGSRQWYAAQSGYDIRCFMPGVMM
jgi:hypothetical protein